MAKKNDEKLTIFCRRNIQYDTMLMTHKAIMRQEEMIMWFVTEPEEFIE